MRLALLVAALAACSSVTEVVVVVSASGVRIPDEVDKVRVVVTNTQAGSPDLPLCGTGNCLTLPIVATLVPGPDRPSDPVTVQVTAYLHDQPVIRDAATFVFQSGQRGRLDFVLFAGCLGKLDCADQMQACVAGGSCAALAVTPLGANPSFDGGVADLAVPGGDLSTTDLSTRDLQGLADLSPLADLAQPDLIEGNFTTATCVAAMSIAASGGFQAGTCSAYCASQGTLCSDTCVTNRGFANFGVEAWATSGDCATYATSAGQADCKDDLTIFSDPDFTKYRCCCR